MNKKQVKKVKLMWRTEWLSCALLIITYTFIIAGLMINRLDIRTKGDQYKDAVFCASNLCDVSFGITRLIIIFTTFVILVYGMRNLFRNSVIIKYGNRLTLLNEMYKTNLLVSAGITLVVGLVSLVLSIILSDRIENNWNDVGSFINIRCNGMETNYLISFGLYIGLFIYGIFVLSFICGQVIILSWCLCSPVMGVVSLLVIWGLETAMSTPLVKVLYTYVSVNSLNIFYNGVDYFGFTCASIIWIIALLLINVVVIRNKNLL